MLGQSYETAPLIVTKPPGPKSREALSKQASLETKVTVYPKAFPMAIDWAKNATIKDLDGNMYIDWVSGISVLNLGHQNPEVTEAVRDQLGKIWHALEIPTEARISFLNEVHSVLPPGLKGDAKVLMTVTGGDACEAAISLAKWVTKRKTMVAFEGAYHGVHQGIVSLTSSRHYVDYAGVPRQGVFRLPYPYGYRFPFPVSKKGDEAKVVLRYLEHLMSDEHSGLDDVAGIMVEPVLGEGGYVVPPPDFLPGLREVADRFQVPLIIDEVQTGFCRTGKFWGCEQTATTPDIMCISKSVGAGIPMSLIAYRKEYDENLPEGFHLGTYRGNPLAMAAGTASIKYIKNHNIQERIQRLGPKMIEEFERVMAKSKNTAK